MIYPGTYNLTLREDKDTRLSVSELDGNFKYLNNLASESYLKLSYDNENVYQIGDTNQYGFTLSNIYTYIFFECVESTDLFVYIPLPEDQTGKKIVFTKTDTGIDNTVILEGLFSDDTEYILDGKGHSVTFLSDGVTWWKIAQIQESFIP
jgi:hypothetical protein